MQEHLQWELHYVDYYNWIVNFSAFLSVKGLALEIVSVEIANETYIDPAIPFACLSGLSIEILEKNENVYEY